MKKLAFFLLIPILLLSSFRPDNDDAMANLYVVFAGASTNFYRLDSVATKISVETGIKYQNYLVFDNKRGMIVPDSSSDEIYAGSYFPRRYAEERISIEMADYYKAGNLLDVDSTQMMTIVTGIFGEKKDAAGQLSKIKKLVPDAYMKRVKLYQGCMH